MVTTIKKGATKEEIITFFEKLTKNLQPKKSFDAFKFCGTIDFKEDGLEIQKRLRDEWR